MKRIAIIDDHKLVGAGFAHLIGLEDNLEVAQMFESYDEAVNSIDAMIDIAIIDISLPEKNGIELAKYLSQHFPSIHKIFVSMYENAHYIKEAQKSGGLAYLSKKCAPDELIDAIHAVLNGDEYYSKDITSQLYKQTATEQQVLTSRELEVLKMLAKGLSPKQVAHELGIMPKTALAHRYNLFNKFNVNNQFDLLQEAINQGLLTSVDISLCSV